MFKRIIALTVLVITAFSLCACAKKEEPALPSSSPEPIAKEEPKEEDIVKEFSDGRLYAEGDIISFAETENYYFTVDRYQSDAFISCYTKEGELLKRAKLETETYYNSKGTVALEKKIYAIPPVTDIYPVQGDSVVFGSSSAVAKFVIANSNLELTTRNGMDYPDFSYNSAEFIENSEGYRDIVSLGGKLVWYKYDASRKACDTGVVIEYPNVFEINQEIAQSAFKTRSGNIFSFGYIDTLSEKYSHYPIMVKHTENYEVADYKLFEFEYDSIFEPVAAGDYIAFAQAVINEETGEYFNRLFVLDNSLNILFTKDYAGECPVEVVSAGENIAVSVYKGGGNSNSYVEILDSNGNSVSAISHKLMYARLLSDKNGGFYITGKQGDGFESKVNTVVYRYNESAELTDETLFKTENDYDNGFGLYFEVNNSGDIVPLQGNIENFPLYLADKSAVTLEISDFASKTLNTYNQYKTSLAVKGEGKLIYPGEYSSYCVTENNIVIYSSENGKKLISLFDKSGKRLWCSEISKFRDSVFELENLVVVYASGELYAYDKNNGKNLWNIELDENVYCYSVTAVGDKIVCLYTKEQNFVGDYIYGACIVDVNGQSEYAKLPEYDKDYLEMQTVQLHSLYYNRGNGNLYGVVGEQGGEKTAIALMNEDFEPQKVFFAEEKQYVNLDIEPSSNRIYLHGQDYSYDSKYYGGVIYALDENLNLIYKNNYGPDEGVYIISFLPDNFLAAGRHDVADNGANINRRTVVLDSNGNEMATLEINGTPYSVIQTNSGYHTLEYMNPGVYLLTTLDSNMNYVSSKMISAEFAFFSDSGKVITN